MSREQGQLALFAPTPRKRSAAGAARSAAAAADRAKPGRKPRLERLGFVEHVARPEHAARHPVHVSMKRVRLAPSFRAERIHAAIVEQIAAAVARGVRAVEYSIQHDHLHLLVEAEDKKDLAKRLQLLFSRIAFAVNRVARRHGSLFRDRHHRRELTTPTETRRVLVYIFFNSRKHDVEHGRGGRGAFALDACTSAAWFDGWHPIVRPPEAALAEARAQRKRAPTSAPTTWLARVGWQRAGGPIRFNELPKIGPKLFG